MTMHRRVIIWSLLIGLAASTGWVKTSLADTGYVRVVFAKASFVAGIGAGSGTLTLRGKKYPFKVTGSSLGATLGLSTSQLVGHAYNLQRPEDLAGTYLAFGAGAAVAAGVNAVRLQNANGVILVLQGVKVGVELSANLAHVTVTMTGG